MTVRRIPSSYHSSLTKRSFDLAFSLISTIMLSPLLILILLAVKVTSPGPAFFIQKRIGKNGNVFKLIKFRTMKTGSEKLQGRYKQFNEADGPVFKIVDDPRLTRFGRFLAHTGLDELPQLINVLRGDMSLVGPRPLPLYEARKLAKSERVRELVKPGITSRWVVQGSHRLKFNEWMKLDEDYVKNASFLTDLTILAKTVLIMLKQTARQTFNLLNFQNFS